MFLSDITSEILEYRSVKCFPYHSEPLNIQVP